MNNIFSFAEVEVETALYLVPTPIGNLEDITLRALKILANVDIIACEDTRKSGQLLKSYKIKPLKLESYHEHNERKKSKYLIDKIINGKSLALISDAGTPAISDPGYHLINEAIKNNIKIIALPGATAFVPALVASGLQTNQFIYLGFPPQKKGRKTFLEQLASYKQTILLYESPYRIIKLIDELIINLGEDREVCIVREISKIYEEYIRGSLSDCKRKLSKKAKIKGEFVVVIAGF